MTSRTVLLLGLFAFPSAFAAMPETVAKTVDALSKNVPAIVATVKTAGTVINAETAARVFAEGAYGRPGPSTEESEAVRKDFDRLAGAGATFRIAEDGSLRIEDGETAFEVIFE